MVSRKLRNGSPGLPAEQSLAKPDDVLVMSTNNSSIVSKRSVERLYYPDEPHFFRFFVPNFKRRAPLINRGYHFRLHVINVTLRNFLSQPSKSRTKVIVNLGCGSDVIPWQCWHRCQDSSRDVQFVDIDFPQLIRGKRKVVLDTPELMAPLRNVNNEESTTNVLLRSDRYTQIGVDLRDIAALETALAAVLAIKDCHFLFVAEVSITYMETEAADKVIEWAATLGQAAEFCLLEQLLPEGPGHPFASTMLSHFDKLSCPIKSVATYPTLESQRDRFRSRAWARVDAQSLWSAWSDEAFLTPSDRQKLDMVEPFDEHEEFALFASHYMLLRARSYGNATVSSESPASHTPEQKIEATYAKFTGQHGLRRFGAAVTIRDHLGSESIINCLGLGNNNRLSSYDVYTQGGNTDDMHVTPPGGPSGRMCATLTDVGHTTVLVGGRSSPAKAMSDCWVFRKETRKWEKTHELPMPVYRHSACRLAESSLVLVLGGRLRESGISSLVAVLHPESGWLECGIEGSELPRVFGAVLICSGLKPRSPQIFEGFMAGGLSDSCILNKSVLAWTLRFDENKKPSICFTKATTRGHDTLSLISRFGAACVQDRGSFILVGGVGSDGVLDRKDEIVVFSTAGSTIEASRRLVLPSDIPRPLIVGSSVMLSGKRELVIISGGATCFSMGTFWTRGTYTLKLDEDRLDSAADSTWAFSHTGEIVQRPRIDPRSVPTSPLLPVLVPIKRASLSAELTFEDVVTQGQPVILEGLDVGSCTSTWSLDYLIKQIGEDRKVVVHDASVKNMDFNAKNFRYATLTFGDFIEQVKSGKRLYLRSLSMDAPSDKPANLRHDFPGLASDIALPDEVKMCRDNMHSSILRISGMVNMWLHFDVQANILIQIVGSKRMLLFPPSDVTHLSFAPGASSSSIDVFESIGMPTLAGTHPLEAELSPGDMLYLPPLWLHAASPVSAVSIAANVFFRNLEPNQYATGRDVYGNKDLAAYEKGRLDISRIVHSFGKVPANYREFYLLRLADELVEKSRDTELNSKGPL